MAPYSASVKVYVNFTGGPFDTSPTWVDMSAYWLSASIRRGRSNELEDFSTGTATLVFDNTTGVFDNSFGPYAGYVTLRKMVKIEATYNATTYPIFQGYAQSWSYSLTDGGKSKRCTLQLADMFSILAAWRLPDTAYELQAKVLQPVAWYGLDDDGGSARNRAGVTLNGTYSGSRTLVDALEYGGGGASSKPYLSYTDMATVGSVGSSTVLFEPSTDYTISGLMSTVYADSSGYYFVSLSNSGGNPRLYIGKNKTTPTAVMIDTSVVLVSVTDGPTLADGNVHHFAAVKSTDTLELFIDGVSIGSDSDGSFDSLPQSYTMASLQTGSGLGSAGTLDEVLIAPVAWTSAQIASLAAAGINGWAGDTASERIARLLDLLGIDSSFYDLDDASMNVGPFVGGRNALDYLASVARSERGRLFVDRAGVLTFHSKTHDWGGSASALFTDASSATQIRYTGFDVELNDRLVFNVVSVSGVGVSYSGENLTSQSSYSVRSLSRSTELPTIAGCKDQVDFVLMTYADPNERGKSWQVAPEVPLNGGVKGSAFASLLPLDLGSVVQVTTSGLSRTLSLTSIEHQITASNWTVTFAATPAQVAGGFVWGSSDWDGSEEWS